MGKRIGIMFVLVAAVLIPGWGLAQLSERPGNSYDNPIDTPRDLTGLSIKNPRVRVVHTTDPAKPGGSMYLQQVDPFLGYKIGWSLTQREFRDRDGVYGDAGKLDGILLPDGSTKMMSRSHVNSCAMCHNTPYRDGGAGANIAKNGGEGRNTPHMFGLGLVEMIGQQLRLDAMAVADTNRDGWISLAEAKGMRCVVHNLPEGSPERTAIDLGSFDDEDGNGIPDLNPLLNPIYVDKDGKRIAFARNLNFPNVVGYKFEVQCFGFGHLYMPFRPPVSTTIRSFIATPFDIHSGMQAFDPTTLNDPDGDGFSQVSNAGSLQCVTAAQKDRGAVRGPTGCSLDDPDRDGCCEELTEGDLDLAEWYLLNHPAPGRGEIDKVVIRGEKLFKSLGCAACHVPDWHLRAANPLAGDYTRQYDGDRRLFDLQATFNDQTGRMEGKLVMLGDQRNGRWVPRRQATTVRGLYSDLKYHDVGEEFYQVQFDGTVVRKWRTSPLWGVGSTGPYGHDGANLTLDSAIRRHGGEALESRKAYAALPPQDRRAVVAFLESLVLYQTEKIPCDVDGDGTISEHFMIAGVDTGIERFNPEWLFKIPGKMEGEVENLRGEKILSCALTNIREAYGLDLDLLKDSDKDGFPDVIDPEPHKKGYLDGVRMPAKSSDDR